MEPACVTESACSLLTFGLLNHITPSHGGISVVVVLLPGDEVDLPEQLLLVMLQLARHRDGGARLLGSFCRYACEMDKQLVYGRKAKVGKVAVVKMW